MKIVDEIMEKSMEGSREKQEKDTFLFSILQNKVSEN
jgi:hypothetical protein